MKVVRVLFLCLFCILPCLVLAQDGTEVSVADINLPNLRWGFQRANFEVTNKTEYLKFISVITTITFPDSYFKPIRTTRSNFVVGPLESKILTPQVYVPGNYGPALITIQLYDVVDTADYLLPRQKFFEQPFNVQYHPTDAMLPYLTKRISMPPLIDKHPTWDNDISREMLVLLREKKTLAEIATMASADTVFIQDLVNRLTEATALRKTDNGYQPTFAVILAAEVEQFRPLAEQLSDTLAALIQKNMPAFRHTRDSLIKAGVMNADTSDFLNPGSVLLKEYPTVGCFLLWNYLGKRFITGDKPFSIYEGTDLCNLYTPFYMYAVQGGEDVTGRHYFSILSGESSLTISFADFGPKIECESDYMEKARLHKPVFSRFSKDQSPEGFVFAPLVIDPAIASLASGIDPLLAKAKADFDVKVKASGFVNFAFGPKYWFWNWTATMTLDKLIKKGVVTRRGNGHYSFQAI